MSCANKCCGLTFIIDEPEELVFEIGEITVIDHDLYPGPYEVIPKTIDQILNTKNKNMSDDVLVHEIPYAEVSNPTGTTVNIAYL